MGTTIQLPCNEFPSANKPIDPITFLQNRAGDYIDQLMGEMAFVAMDTLKTLIPDSDDVDIWSLAVEIFMFDGLKRRVEGNRHDTIESSSMKTMFSMAGASLFKYRDDPALPAVMQTLLPMVSEDTRRETQAYIIDKVLPVIHTETQTPGTHVADGLQIGRAKRMRFLYLESGIDMHSMNTAICHFSGEYKHALYAALAPLRTAVYFFLIFTYHTLWRHDQDYYSPI